ncbi:hypothetical protein N0V88_001893 [Collariella sp. IMI 366227]|nr:hypothetical protein N0V88_001893 [Collariella sp. IMI 366227]
MKKTLLLCFIHGFKGDDETFGKKYAFVEHLRQQVAGALPKLDVQAVVYPKYETRGDLGECVSRFSDWLLNKVIDIEPHQIQYLHATSPNALMFPYIQGVLAFDTPALPAPSQGGGAAAGGKEGEREGEEWWGVGKWGTIAMAAGAVGAVAAGGAAAYLNREHISQGLGWATSHLEFVGCLARKEELRRRVAYMVRLNREVGVGFGNLYTRLGQSAGAKQVSMVGTVLGSERTFCVVPQRDQAGEWRAAVNDKAKDETGAHMAMFEPRENPNYEKLAGDARDMIADWLRNDWYESSSAESPKTILP